MLTQEQKNQIWEQLKRYLTQEEQSEVSTNATLRKKLTELSEKLIESSNLPKPKCIVLPQMYFQEILSLFPEARKRTDNIQRFVTKLQDNTTDIFLEVFGEDVVVDG